MLLTVTVPENVTEIGEAAFGYVLSAAGMKQEGFVIRCYEDSAAHRYALDNEIEFELIEKKEPESEPDSESDSESDSEPDSESESEPESEPDSLSESEADSSSKADGKSESNPKTGAAAAGIGLLTAATAVIAVRRRK